MTISVAAAALLRRPLFSGADPFVPQHSNGPTGRALTVDRSFFYSMPSAVALCLYEWVTEGTSQGSLLYQLYVTMEEAGLGFLSGSIIGVICGAVPPPSPNCGALTTEALQL